MLLGNYSQQLSVVVENLFQMIEINTKKNNIKWHVNVICILLKIGLAVLDFRCLHVIIDK